MKGWNWKEGKDHPLFTFIIDENEDQRRTSASEIFPVTTYSSAIAVTTSPVAAQLPATSPDCSSNKDEPRKSWNLSDIYGAIEEIQHPLEELMKVEAKPMSYIEVVKKQE